MMIVNLPKDKKHVMKDEKETQEILNRMERLSKIVSLYREVRNFLNEVADSDERFSFFDSPSIANNKTIYILWDKEVFGEFYIKFRSDGDSIVFIHGNAEYSYEWKELKNNLSKLKDLLSAYIAGFDEFEEMVGK